MGSTELRSEMVALELQMYSYGYLGEYQYRLLYGCAVPGLSSLEPLGQSLPREFPPGGLHAWG